MGNAHPEFAERGRPASYRRASGPPSRRHLPRSPIRTPYDLKPGVRVEAFDVWRSTRDDTHGRLVFRWRPARIRELTEDSALVAFDGFSERWDVWVRLDDGKLRPPASAKRSETVTCKGVPYPAREESRSATASARRSSSSSNSPFAAGRRHSYADAAASCSSEEDRSLSSLAVETGLEPLPLRHLFRRRPSSQQSNAQKPAPFVADGRWPGFVNLGNTCFFNAMLQCLTRLEDLRAYFASPLFPQDLARSPSALARAPPRNPDLARAFARLLEAQDAFSGGDRAPVDAALRQLWTCVTTSLPQFKGSRQQDAQELFVGMLDKLHESLNRIGRKPTYVELDPPHTLSQSKLAELYWDNYERGQNSVFKDLFCGQLMSRAACLDCGANSTSFDAFWDLSLCLGAAAPAEGEEEAGEAARQSVRTCLDAFCAVEKLEGYFCAKCAKSSEGRRQLTVTKWPRVLVVHLKRFGKRANGTWAKRSDAVELDHTLQVERDGPVFDLVGVVSHSGSVASGHYFADARTRDGAWVRADDEVVSDLVLPSAGARSGAYLLWYTQRER
jgi:ubiquitin C-terminal hydrolase